jgi:hypothetical protein
MQSRLARTLLVACLALVPAAASAQGVTTSSIAGTVTGSGAGLASATVRAVHLPSGTAYSTTTRPDGRYTIPGMRIGGPYQVVARAIGFAPATRDSIYLNLGVGADVSIELKAAAVQIQELVVTETSDLSSTRTGASTTISREALDRLPTIGRTITDFTRLTPQASGSSFAGQDTRYNNITVDGSYFNNSFGLGSQPGARTGVSPLPIDAIDQIQVNIAPYDVRQGNFVGAGVNAVTRSGTNEFSGSFYRIQRDQGLVGTTAGPNTFNPGSFKYGLWGGRIGGPIIKDKLFFFASVEDDKQTSPGTTFQANTGGQPVAGNTTRVLASDLQGLSDYLAKNFGYQTGPFSGYNFSVPSRRYLGKLDFNLDDRNKFSLRYTQLNSSSDQLISGSASLGNGRRQTATDFLSFQNSNYAILENIKSLVGEWNSQVGSHSSNDLIIGYTTNDESRDYAKRTIFPFVDILQSGSTYTSFGLEPFTPANQLRYKTLQLQDNFTIYGDKHDITFGVTGQKYNSTNVFYPGSQSAYVYNSLADFYADANDYLANPNRTTSPVTLNRFQVRYNNIPGQTQPVQPLEVYYTGAYVQDEWRIAKGLKITGGIRFDIPFFTNTAFANPQADALTFRDETGAAAKYSTGKLPGANVLFSPRFGFNWDVSGDRSTVVRGGSGIFTGSPPYVWISNQIGQNGVITGFNEVTNTTAFPFNPNPDKYKPAASAITGAPAATYEVDYTAQNYKFPQLWRSNIAIDQRLPWGIVGTGEFLYSKDVNGAYYINANLVAPTATGAGPDTRPIYPGGAADRINANITGAYVLKNQSVGYSYNAAASLEKAFDNGFFAKVAYSYGVARNTVDPGSIASGTWTGNAISGDPNNPGRGYSQFSPGKRAFVALSYRREYFKHAATTISVFLDGSTQGNASYAFAGDANRDGATNNDLIYIPKDQSEMRFQQYTVGTTTYTAAQQSQAWDAFIAQDPYLSKRRGQYAERNGFFLPMVWRADVSLVQDLFQNLGGKRNTLQARVDILNATNLINSNWGVGDRLVTTQPLTNPSLNASGEIQYRLRAVNGQLINTTFQKSANLADVYRVQLSFRYNFN